MSSALSLGPTPDFMAGSKGYHDNKDGVHMMGTTIMAVSFDGGVILGADSRTSTGSYVANRVSDKLTSVASNIYCCRSGSAADTQAISDMVRYVTSTNYNIRPHVSTLAKTELSIPIPFFIFSFVAASHIIMRSSTPVLLLTYGHDKPNLALPHFSFFPHRSTLTWLLPLHSYYLDVHAMESGRNPRVKTASNLFRDLCYKNKDRLLAGIICAGYDDVDGGSVYSISIGGSLVKQDYSIGGSGSTYVYGYCDANYKKGMSKEDCKKFTTHAIAHAMARDGSSGGVIRLVIIDKEGVTREFIPGDQLPYNLE